MSIKVSGMTCKHCANTVKNLVMDERGVKQVLVSLENSTVNLIGDHKMNRNQIIAAVNLSGTYKAN